MPERGKTVSGGRKRHEPCPRKRAPDWLRGRPLNMICPAFPHGTCSFSCQCLHVCQQPIGDDDVCLVSNH
ncbi:hypothetical protein RHECNPAF_750025 [Rhizobium etli CNPAF512]|nr:hypothetical protein RHECNPAF_750025 [Rhizobium etli CNPAF512]